MALGECCRLSVRRRRLGVQCSKGVAPLSYASSCDPYSASRPLARHHPEMLPPSFPLWLLLLFFFTYLSLRSALSLLPCPLPLFPSPLPMIAFRNRPTPNRH